MLKAISNLLHGISKGWVALIALVIFVVFSATVLPKQAEKAEQNANGGVSPDMSLSYTTEDLYGMAESYGVEGREAYVRARFSFDLIWPLVYTAFLGTSISWAFQWAFEKSKPEKYSNLAPVFALLFDFLENLATSLVMTRYPSPTPVVAGLAPIFTLVKWVFVGGSFVILLIGLATKIWRTVTGRTTPAQS